MGELVEVTVISSPRFLESDMRSPVTVVLCLALCLVAPSLGAEQEDCPDTYVKIRGNCYHFSNDKLTYYAAKQKGNLLTSNRRIQAEIINHLIELNKDLWGPARKVYWINSYFEQCLTLGPSHNSKTDPPKSDLHYYVDEPSHFSPGAHCRTSEFYYIIRK